MSLPVVLLASLGILKLTEKARLSGDAAIGIVSAVGISVTEVSAISTLAAISDVGLQSGREVDLVVKRASAIFSLMRPHVDTVFEDLWETGRSMGQTLLRSMMGEPAEQLAVLQSPKLEFLPHG